MYGLRLLEASCCLNATPSGLTEALRHFNALVSLDLSETRAARDASVLKNLNLLHGLRVLKLRSIGLEDNGMYLVAAAIGTRVKSLDICDNRLTDKSARILLEHCFQPRSMSLVGQNASLPCRDDCSLHLNLYKDEHIDKHIRKRLTDAFVYRLTIEDSDEDGITHLYISKNRLTVEGVSGLVGLGRLYVLDVGTLENVARRMPQDGVTDAYLNIPGAEKLTPLLARCASQKLTYLRIHHGIITKEARTTMGTHDGRAELEAKSAPFLSEKVHELDTTQTVYELPGSEPVAELPGESAHGHGAIMQPHSMAATPVSLRCRTVQVEKPHQLDTQGSHALASNPNGDGTVLSTAGSELSSAANAINGVPYNLAAHGGSKSPELYLLSLFTRIENMRARLDRRQSEEHHLHPRMLPKLRTLVLTDIPTATLDPDIPRRLIQFIEDCAEETQIAKLSAQATYALPPGRNRQVAEREYAHSLFALQRIVFEVVSPESLKANKKPPSAWRLYPTKASTEDPDSEAFWTAAEHDFSFFGDEECGLPTMVSGSTLPLAIMSEKMVVEPGTDIVPPYLPAQQQQLRQAEQSIDVIARISLFRKERKAAFEAALRRRQREPIVDGYWPGDIVVVRPQTIVG